MADVRLDPPIVRFAIPARKKSSHGLRFPFAEFSPALRHGRMGLGSEFFRQILVQASRIPGFKATPFVAFIVWEAAYAIFFVDLHLRIGPVAKFLAVAGVGWLAIFYGWRIILAVYPIFLAGHLWLHHSASLPWLQGWFGPILGGAACVLVGLTSEYYRRAIYSERKLAESLEALADSLDQQTRFMAMAAHEIRTPLNAISGHTQLLLRAQDAGPAREGLVHIRKATEHLGSLVANILDLARAKTETLALNLSTESLISLLSDTVDMHTPFAALKGLKLAVSIDERIPEFVELDRMRLTQVLSNLISNAIKYTRTGSVTLEARVVHRKVDATNVEVQFSVRDTGIGIAAEHQKAVFDAFYKIDPRGSPGEGSVGLGLSIAAHLCKLMGGQLKLESVPGKGSVFSFSVRFRKASGGGESAIASSVANPGPTRAVWIADDNEANLIVLGRMLESLGFEVQAFGDGAEVLDFIEANDARPDVMILDAHMGRMGGLETAAELSSRDPLISSIPRILLTAETLTPKLEDRMRSSFDQILYKPLDIDDLAQAMDRSIEQAMGSVDRGLTGHT